MSPGFLSKFRLHGKLSNFERTYDTMANLGFAPRVVFQLRAPHPCCDGVGKYPVDLAGFRRGDVFEN